MIERRSALADHPMMQRTSREAPAPVVLTERAPVVLTERRSVSIVQISAFSTSIAEAGARLADALAAPLPAPSRFSGSVDLNLRASGPGNWLVVGRRDRVPPADNWRATLRGTASVVDLSHARSTFQLRGAAAARTLAGLCSLDLHSKVFPTGSTAQSRLDQIGMHLARIDDGPTFELMIFRGYAEFVFEALLNAGAEFGIVVEASETHA